MPQYHHTTGLLLKGVSESFSSEPALEDPAGRRLVTDSDGFTGSNAGLDPASSASAGNDLLITRLPC